MKEISYELLVENYLHMINVLEYDSMRSPGKAKMNSQHLHSLYFLLEIAEKKAKKQPAKEG